MGDGDSLERKIADKVLEIFRFSYFAYQQQVCDCLPDGKAELMRVNDTKESLPPSLAFMSLCQ
jgi:hypothetical protein